MVSMATVKVHAPAMRLSARRQRFLLMASDAAFLILFTVVWDPVTIGYDILGLAILLIFRWQAGLYRARFQLSALDEMPKALIAGFVASGVFAFMAAMPLFNISIDDVVWVSFAGIVLLFVRMPVYVLLRDLRRNDVARERLLLVGGGVIADAISEMAQDNPEYGLDLVDRVPDLLSTDLVAEAARARASTVLVAFSRASEAREVFEIRRGLDAGLRVMAVPRYFDLIKESRVDDVIFGMPVQRLGGVRSPLGLRLKRVFDVVLATVGLICSAPLLAIFGPRDGRGPAVPAGAHRQGRPGVRTVEAADDEAGHRVHVEHDLDGDPCQRPARAHRQVHAQVLLGRTAAAVEHPAR